MQRWNPDPNVRRNPADYPLTGDADIRPVMYNGVGGGLVQWAAMWQPLLASDFRVRSLDGVADDWPIGWADLAAPYAAVARDMSVSGLAGDPALPDMEAYPNPPVPIGRIGAAARPGHGPSRLALVARRERHRLAAATVPCRPASAAAPA